MHFEDGSSLSMVSSDLKNPSIDATNFLHRVNNCVGFSNYKYFVLFLFYSVLLCVWLSITGLNAFIAAWVRRCTIMYMCEK